MKILLWTLFFLLPFSTFAGELNGAKFPDTVNLGRANLTLNGMGMRTATLFKVKVYAAGLYLTQKSKDAKAVLAMQWPMQMQMEFFREVEDEKIRDAWDRSFKDNCGEKCQELAKGLGQLKNLMASVKKGDRMIYTFQESGVEVALNGKKVGDVPGADFARFVLSTWLGDHPPNEALKTGLLGIPE